MHIVGVDPGLQDTGVVGIRLDFDRKLVDVQSTVVNKGKPAQIIDAVKGMEPSGFVFCEEYNPRHTLNTDRAMVELQHQLKLAMPSIRLVKNTGVQQVIKQGLMELLHVWSFHTATRHQDLRSAARIALYGAVKNPKLNKDLFNFVASNQEERWGYVAQPTHQIQG